MGIKIKKMGTNTILSKYVHYETEPSGNGMCREEMNLIPSYETHTVETASSLPPILKHGAESAPKSIPAPKKRLTNGNIIKNISSDQTEILHNIMELYNGGKPFECDMTASELKFYGNGRGKYDIPVPEILFDVYPQDEKIKKIEKWGNLPLENGSIHSMVIDLPFVISPANAPSSVNPSEGSQLIMKRFSAYYPVDNLYLSYYHWISEAYRVLDEGGLLIFKEQSMISGGIRHNTDEFSFMAAHKLGFKMIDKFILQAKARLISNAKMKNGQKHSRSYTSQFLVFVKEKKRKSKEFDYFELLERCEREQNEGFANVVEK
jgi:hypothetical protein